MTIKIDSDQLTKLLRDPIIVRIVSIIDIASLSILELLEYDDLTQRNSDIIAPKDIEEQKQNQQQIPDFSSYPDLSRRFSMCITSYIILRKSSIKDECRFYPSLYYN